LRSALKLGVQLDLTQIRADELCVMLLLEEERDRV